MRKWENKSILVVDDSEIVREELAEIYRAVGLRVGGFAKDGVEALSQIEQLKPDIVSLDIIMPEMDGIECYIKIEELKDTPLVLIVSALANEERVVGEYAERIPRERYLPKPLTVDEVTDRLDQVFS